MSKDVYPDMDEFWSDVATAWRQAMLGTTDPMPYVASREQCPGLARTLFGDDERYKSAYWSQIPGVYFTGDGARRARARAMGTVDHGHGV